MARERQDTAIYTAYDDLEPFDVSDPEKKLLCAILLNALTDLKKPGDANRRATQYLLNAEDQYIFSFRSICQHLNIEPDKILMVSGVKKSGHKFSVNSELKAKLENLIKEERAK